MTTAKAAGLRHFLNLVGPFFGLLLVLGLFSLSADVRPYLFTGGNFKIILIQTVIVAIGALGMTMIIVSGGIDLSVGSVVALTSVLGATLLVRGYSTAATMALVILCGGVIGLINGAVIAAFRMMPFIVTLGMMGIVRGTAKWLAGNQTVNNPPDTPLNNLMARALPTQLFPLPPGVWIAIGLAIVMSVVLRQTVFGRYIFAIGSNEATARLCGIRVPRHKVLIIFWAGGFDATFAPDARRSDGGRWAGTGHHCRSGDRRREFKRRNRQHTRLDDRRVDHGRVAQRVESDGLADVHAGNHHRRGDHPGGRTGPPPPKPEPELNGLSRRHAV